MSESSVQFLNNGKYCEYYKDKGHTTQDCKALDKALSEVEKKSPQVNLISKQSPAGTIFTILEKIHSKRSLEILTIIQTTKKPKVNFEPISFYEKVLKCIKVPHQDPLVIVANINNYIVNKILIDIEASIDILYWNIFKNMNLKEENLKTSSTPVKGFSQVKISVVGYIAIKVILEEGIFAITN